MATASPHDAGMNGAVVRQIKAEAGALGLTDAQLAAATGLHPTMVSRYLNFKRGLTTGLIERFANALDITYPELVQRAWSQRQEK